MTDPVSESLKRSMALVHTMRECQEILDELLEASAVELVPAVGFFRSAQKDEEGAPTVDPARLALTIGSRIRAHRERLGLTQNDLAQTTGIHRPNIARLEKGVGLPNLATVIKVANGLSVTLESLI